MTEVRKSGHPLKILLGLVFALAVTGCERTNEATITFAGARDVWWTAPTIIAVDDKLTKGVKVHELKFTSGRDSMNAVINGGADIGLVASTPLAMEAAKGSNLKILGVYVQSDTLISFLSKHKLEPKYCVNNPKACADEADNMLTVYVPNTISQFYLLRYLEACKLNDRQVKEVMKKSLLVQPSAVPSAFGSDHNNRRVDTAVIWEPWASLVRVKHSDLAVSKPMAGIYTLALYLITRNDLWEQVQRRTAILAFVKSVRDAGNWIKNNRDRSRTKIEELFKYDGGWLAERWENVDFSFDTDKSKIEDLLLKDARLAKDNGILKDTDPNSQEYKQSVERMLNVLEEVRKAL